MTLRPRRLRSLRPRRVAVLSVHTSPLEQPGTGDAGGMNVYVLETSKRLAALGVDVEVFTRATSGDLPPVVELEPGVTVRHVTAGPLEGLGKEDLPSQLCALTSGVLRAEARHDPGWYDVVHSHYWLSGQVGWLAKERWGVPLVHTGMHHLHASGVGVVQLEELAGLDVGVRDQHVGGLDDLLLADHTSRRLERVPHRERRVLDLGHGVHGVHQRDAPPVPHQGTDLAGEPVVRVHDVVPALVVAGLGTEHLTGEGTQLTGQLRLGQTLERAGVHVVHGDTGEGLDRGRQQGGRGTGVDLDGEVAGGAPPGQLDDVDVHPAGVTGAGLVQGRGVHADHRHPAMGPAVRVRLEQVAHL